MLLGGLLWPVGGWGQPAFLAYTAADGLPNEMALDIARDSLGFVWIATEEGVVRYDGYTFQGFLRSLPAPFMKALTPLRDGRLLVTGDAGIMEIHPDPVSPSFSVRVESSAAFVDSLLWYPKNLYEARDGTWWVSEPDAIVAIRAGQLRRYLFPPAYETASFFRAFVVAEDRHGQLWAMAHTGHLFAYEAAGDSFRRVPVPPLTGSIGYFAANPAGGFWVGGEAGFFAARLAGTGWEVTAHLPLPHVSTAVRRPGGRHWVGSWKGGLVAFGGEQPPHPLPGVPAGGITGLYAGPDTSQVWIALDRGIALAAEGLFQEVPLPQSRPSPYLEAIGGDGQGTVWVADRYTLYRLRPGEIGWTADRYYYDEAAYLLAMVPEDSLVYLASRHEVLTLRGGQVVARREVGHSGDYVFDLARGPGGDLWAVQYNQPGAYRLGPGGSTRHYGRGLGTAVQCVAQTSRGFLAGGQGADTYLYCYDAATDSFVNLSQPLPRIHAEPGGLIVRDLTEDTRGRIWLATNQGLICYAGDSLRRYPIGGQDAYPVLRACVSDPEGALWLALGHGIMSYYPDENAQALFRSRHGLPSPTLHYRCLHLMPDGTLWAATVQGLAQARLGAPHPLPTPAPHLTQLAYNDQVLPVAHLAKTALPPGGFLRLHFRSPSFPGDLVSYQYRWGQRPDSRWQPLTYDEGLILPGLEAGAYVLEVRSRHHGAHDWSAVVRLPFRVRSWLPKGWLGLLLVLGGAGVLGWGYTRYHAYRLRRHNAQLEAIVQERTQALERSIAALRSHIDTHLELERLLRVISHDLREPLRNIRGFGQLLERDYGSQLDARGQEFIQHLIRASDQMNGLTLDLSTYFQVRSRQPVFKEIDTVRLFQQIQHELEGEDELPPGCLHFGPMPPLVQGDAFLLHYLFRELIHNACRFARPEVPLHIHLTGHETADTYVLLVRDNGIGIAPAYQQQIFSLFERLHPRQYGGSGVGLTLVRWVARQHGGQVRLASTPGEGSSFFVDLPKQPAPVPGLEERNVQANA